MPSKGFVSKLQDSVEDVKVIYEYYCENGSKEGIIELISPIKYLLACIIDILNDRLIDSKQFYTSFKRLKDQNPNKYIAAKDEFDKGVFWLIEKLNDRNLHKFLIENTNEIEKFYLRTSETQKHWNIFLACVEDLEKSVRFKLHPEDLYAMKIRFKPKRSAEEQTETEEYREPLKCDGIEKESNEVMTSSFISMEAIDVKLLQERELKIDNGLINKIKYNALRLVNNLKIKNRLKANFSTYSIVQNDRYNEFESINIYSRDQGSFDEEFNFSKMEICPERGLAAQNYCCTGCGNGISKKGSLKCDFSGEYLCLKCHGGLEGINPIRIIKNWDFTRYPISAKSRQKILKISYNVPFNFSALNPNEIKTNPKFEPILKLREKIFRLTAKRVKAAGKSDGAKQMEALEKLAWPKLHLLTSTDLFTIEDLVEIENGSFVPCVLAPLYNLLKF